MEKNTSLETLIDKIFNTIFYYRGVDGKVRQAKLLSVKVEQTMKPWDRSFNGCIPWNNFEVSFIVAGYNEPQKITTNLQHDCRECAHFTVPNLFNEIDCRSEVNIQKILNCFIECTMVQVGIYPYFGKHLYDTFKYWAIDGETIVEKAKFIRGMYVDANSIMFITFSDVPKKGENWAIMDKTKKSYMVSATSDALNKKTFAEFTKTRDDIQREFTENNLICFGDNEYKEPKFNASLIRSNVLQFLGADLDGVKISGQITINGNIVVL